MSKFYPKKGNLNPVDQEVVEILSGNPPIPGQEYKETITINSSVAADEKIEENIMNETTEETSSTSSTKSKKPLPNMVKNGLLIGGGFLAGAAAGGAAVWFLLGGSAPADTAK